ncbi:MAG: V-type ATP synthase subunit I, partial [Treponema sp.]|nr:V-type ATP synthase subunit I [Treponema sp.]
IVMAIAGIIWGKNKNALPVYKLGMLLGISNFIWGVLTCTWLGLDTDKLPGILQDISLPLISNVTAAKSAYYEGIVRQNLMIFCFTLGLLQCSIGHIINITRTRTLKLLADVGSLGMLAGMYGIILSLIASNESRQIPLYTPCFYIFGGGFLLNFVFGNYSGSVLKSILEGFKNFISAILSVGNTFGDIMSYIRLWAVGLAGAAIASTVNFLAGNFLGHLIFFAVGVLIIILGHSLNFVLNALSVLVHGVRLNILEFSGHAGLTWSGTAYRPFKNRN